MSNIDPVIQARVRQLLGLRGAPAIDPIEAVQPVVMVAGFPTDRQPQLESGDMIIRRFTASGIQASVAGQYSQCQLRTLAADSVIWVTAIWPWTGLVSTRVLIGRSANIAAATWGTANWTDWRLPFNSLAGSFDLALGSSAAPSVMYGATIIHLGPNTLRIPVDFILQGGPLEGLEVRCDTVNLNLGATFEGILFSRA